MNVTVRLYDGAGSACCDCTKDSVYIVSGGADFGGHTECRPCIRHLEMVVAAKLRGEA